MRLISFSFVFYEKHTDACFNALKIMHIPEQLIFFKTSFSALNEFVGEHLTPISPDPDVATPNLTFSVYL